MSETASEQTEFDTISDEALVDLLGLDEVSELYRDTFNGQARIAVCDGMWVKRYRAAKWHFEAMEHAFPAGAA